MSGPGKLPCPPEEGWRAGKEEKPETEKDRKRKAAEGERRKGVIDLLGGCQRER